jgi:hypothetical protein
VTRGQPPIAWWQDVAIAYPCEYCGARPGMHCQSSNGERRWTVHVDRARRAAALVRHNVEPPGDVHCMTCGVLLRHGSRVGAECGRCTRVRELTAEALEPSPRRRRET